MVIRFSTADRGTTINLTANLTGVSWSNTTCPDGIVNVETTACEMVEPD